MRTFSCNLATRKLYGEIVGILRLYKMMSGKK